MKTLIIIPTFNEVENIKTIVPEIFKILSGVDFSILIVDDNSNDGTKEVLSELKKQYLNIYVLNRPSKLGLASAYIDGFKYGLGLNFDSFIQMDADFSHKPEYLPLMFEKLKDNDLVVASRNIKGGRVEGWGFLRNFISKGGSLYSKIILNCPIYDLTGGFNAWRADILNKINLDKIISKGYSFQIEMKYKAYLKGAKFVEFPITFIDRKKGKSKMSKSIFFEALLNVLKIRLLYE